jgi:hypothetical protein
MKKLLYKATMFFNFTGLLFSVLTIAKLKTLSLSFLPLIFLSIAIFTISFGITYLDYHYKNNVLRHEIFKKYKRSTKNNYYCE